MGNTLNRDLSNPLVLPGLWVGFSDMSSKEAGLLGEYAESIRKHYLESRYGRQPVPEHLDELTYGHPGIEELKTLKKGWDGYDAEPPTENIIRIATDVWDLVEGAYGREPGMPDITPGASGIVAFTWKQKNTCKQLEVWIHDQPTFFADWCLLYPDDSMHDGEISSIDNLIPILEDFLQAN